jgi:hypothetical protein
MFKKIDSILGSILILLSIFLLRESISFPKSHIGLSPGSFPTFALVGIVILSIVLIIRDFVKGGSKISIKFTKKELKILLFSLGSFLIFILTLNYLGFLYSLIILIFLISLLAGYKPWYKALLFSVIICLVSYYIFSRIFLVPFLRPSLPIPFPF